MVARDPIIPGPVRLSSGRRLGHLLDRDHCGLPLAMYQSDVVYYSSSAEPRCTNRHGCKYAWAIDQ